MTKDILSAEKEKFEEMIKNYLRDEAQFRVMDKYPTDTEQYRNALERDRKQLKEDRAALPAFLLASNQRVRLQTLQEVIEMCENEKRLEVSTTLAIEREQIKRDNYFYNLALSSLAAKLSAIIINEK